MPVEIRELIIRTNISDSQNSSRGVSPEDLAQLKKQLVSEVLQQVKNDGTKKFNR